MSNVIYGRLYNSYTVDSVKFAPTDWKVPSSAEFDVLKTFAGGSTTAGAKLKEAGLIHWNNPNTGTDDYGFSMYGSGRRSTSADFRDLKSYGYLWGESSIYHIFNNSSSSLGSGMSTFPNEGYSVRFIWAGAGIPPSRINDIDGNTYDVIQIGIQYWLKQNWACTKLNDGTPIPNITDDGDWSSNTVGAYCDYDNDQNLSIKEQVYSSIITKHNVDLYPTGNFFALNIQSIIYKVNDAIGLYMSRAYDSVKYIMDAILPDSDRFDIVALEDWERVFGIIAGGTFDERVALLIQRFQFPGDTLARQSAVYIEDQLQLAGFDVYVKYNRFDAPITLESRAGFARAGLSRAGGEVVNEYRFERHEPEVGYTELIANNIDPVRDSTIFDRSNGSAAGFVRAGRNRAYSGTIADREVQLRGTFFISDAVYPNLANISTGRRDEFRDLILRLKPAQTVGYLYINYT